MNNYNSLIEVFADTFNLDLADINQDLSKDTIESWDSVAQLSLVNAVEDKFGIMFETEDIINFSSFKSAITILGKYGIDFS